MWLPTFLLPAFRPFPKHFSLQAFLNANLILLFSCLKLFKVVTIIILISVPILGRTHSV